MRIMLRCPYTGFFVEPDGSWMVGHGEVGQRLMFFRPFFEERMESLEFCEVFPPCFHHRIDRLFTDFGRANEMEGITNHMGVTLHTRTRVRLYNSSAVTSQYF